MLRAAVHDCLGGWVPRRAKGVQPRSRAKRSSAAAWANLELLQPCARAIAEEETHLAKHDSTFAGNFIAVDDADEGRRR